MAEIIRLANLPVGSTALLPVRLTAKSGAGATLEALARDVDGIWTATGSFSIAVPAGTVTGAWTTDPRDQPVRVVAFALQIGDVVRNDTTGEVLVVQAVRLGQDGSRWSPSTAQRPSYDGAGWTVVGHVDLPP